MEKENVIQGKISLFQLFFFEYLWTKFWKWLLLSFLCEWKSLILMQTDHFL